MIDEKSEKQHLLKLKPRKYRIYGIFHFKTNTLIHVDLDLESITFKFGLDDYDEDEYDVVSFDILIT